MTTVTEPPLVVIPESFMLPMKNAHTQKVVVGSQKLLFAFEQLFGCKVARTIFNEITEP